MSGTRPKSPHRLCLAFVAGMLALLLQVLAPIMPPVAMAEAMALAAATPEEAASFASTCLGLGRPDADPAIDHQAKCPICLSIAQSQGFAPAAVSTATIFAWTLIRQSQLRDMPVMESAASAFASRAPPVA